jgi:hypothetical protein
VPPHNLREIAAGVKQLVIDPECTIADLRRHIPGPDFPDGRLHRRAEGIAEMYKTGRGRIVMRARIVKESLRAGKEQLVVSRGAVRDQQDEDHRADRGAGAEGQDRRGERHPRRVRPGRHPAGHRAQARRERQADARRAVPRHQPARRTFGAILLALDDGQAAASST